eukprot:scaffold94485_cov21-Tisochrysis_lutea.AAC.3
MREQASRHCFFVLYEGSGHTYILAAGIPRYTGLQPVCVDVSLHMLACKPHLEGLSLSLATPDTQDEGDLDLGQVHEVLGHVDGHLVQESGGDVVAVLNVVEGGASCADVVMGRQDG